MTGFNEDKVLADGNTAAALGTIFGGVSFVAWYPITPASSVPDGLNKYLPKLRTDPETGKATSPLSRRRTSWPRSAWSSARAGPARAR
jgi:TPP-dependent indolepyruvate ferredoxin oxidoreductase alpha subunit